MGFLMFRAQNSTLDRRVALDRHLAFSSPRQSPRLPFLSFQSSMLDRHVASLERAWRWRHPQSMNLPIKIEFIIQSSILSATKIFKQSLPPLSLSRSLNLLPNVTLLQHSRDSAVFAYIVQPPRNDGFHHSNSSVAQALPWPLPSSPILIRWLQCLSRSGETKK